MTVHGQGIAEPPTPRSRWKLILILATVAAVAIFAIMWTTGTFSSPVKSAYEECSGGPGVIIYNQYNDPPTAKISGAGMVSDNDSDMQVASCMLSELDTPDRLYDKIAQTSALQGQQSDEWKGVRAYWNYHPDQGLEITFEDS